MGAAAATLATAKAAAIMAVAKATAILALAKAAAILAAAILTTRRMIRTGVGKKRSRVGIRLRMT